MPLFQEGCLQSWPPAASCVAPDWQPCVADFLASVPGQQLSNFLNQRLAQKATIYPPQPLRALALTPLSAVKVVILGQDPYHGPGQAEGLAFSVAPGTQPPPSLRNIFKELHQEGMPPRAPGGSLAAWAGQGVLLLNTCLTVEDGLPASHAKRGWEALTDAVVRQVAQTAPVCVYLLWGAHAQSKAPLIQQVAATFGRRSLLLQSNHPSPLSALRPPTPFIGCSHFRLANDFLLQSGAAAIDWSHTA
nr:uracil-DNA glycosylase [uncultured Albidiferax sp.]